LLSLAVAAVVAIEALPTGRLVVAAAVGFGISMALLLLWRAPHTR
tara:strand:- start:170 stop:304 length:135 start_codon:yes stop_codon:yes gene_type:complete